MLSESILSKEIDSVIVREKDSRSSVSIFTVDAVEKIIRIDGTEVLISDVDTLFTELNDYVFFQSSDYQVKDFITEASLGNVPNFGTVNKFGYNEDVDNGSEEVIASFGGSINIMTSPDTLDISSSDSEDNTAGTGARLLLIQGIDGDSNDIEEYIATDGTNTVTTVNSYLGVNRIYVVQSGSSKFNTGNIDASDTTGDVGIQARIPIGKKCYSAMYLSYSYRGNCSY